MKNKIGFIGAGNMATAFIRGLLKHHYPPELIYASDSDQTKTKQLCENFGINLCTDNFKLIESSEIVILAVKPQIAASVLIPLTALIQQQRPLILSVIAGISSQVFYQCLGKSLRLVRSMPNTPASIGVGATALFASSELSDEDRTLAESLFKSIGLVVWVSNESQLDMVTALSGSGPAYYFAIFEILEKISIKYGLPTEIALPLILQTAKGAAEYAQTSGQSIAALRQQVTSPGGTTESALKVLFESALPEILEHMLTAACSRAQALSIEYGSIST